MPHLMSLDGTRISWVESGTGSPIILIPGSTHDAAALGGVSGILSERHHCFAVDRRGRGSSDDGTDFDIQREYEDVAEVVDSVGESVVLFGHSYGAICALGATSLTTNIARLVLYEAPFPIDGPVPPATLQAARSALESGDPRKALLVFLRDVVQLSADELAFVGQLPEAWFETFAPTAIREMEAVSALSPDLQAYAIINTPTRLLVGTESPSHVVRATEELAETLGAGHVATLEGQAHNAILLAPGLVADRITEFLEGTAAAS